MCDFNRSALWHLSQYISKWQAAQYDWVVAGDFNMRPEALEAPWLHPHGRGPAASSHARLQADEGGAALDD